MASIHDLPEEILHHVLSYFVFTDPWQSMLHVNKKWREIVSGYLPTRKKDYIASLKMTYEMYCGYLNPDLPIQAKAKGLYDMVFELAKKPEQLITIAQLVMIYNDATKVYKSLPLKHLSGLLIRLNSELLVLNCSALMWDALHGDPHEASMALRQMAHLPFYQCPPFGEYIIQAIRRNLYQGDVNEERQSAALFNLSRIINYDDQWEQAKHDELMHDVVPPYLIPSYAILTTEMKRAKRIEIIAKYYSVNQLVDNYHNWNLWQRIVVLQQLARNIHSLIDQEEYMTLIEFLATIIVDMSDNRELIASNFGEFFDIVDVLGHFCTTPLNEELLGILLVKQLSETMTLFQYDFPHLTDVVHGFLVKIRQLILFMKYDASSDPEFIENFYPLWCDDSAVKKRKLWFIRHLICPQNIPVVKLELECLVEYEENSTVKRLAQEILDWVSTMQIFFGS